MSVVTSVHAWGDQYLSITKGYFSCGGYSEERPASNSKLQSC